ncbi:hypothetical protein BO85DRAFT_454193 [Aspergillus piperis CBS 112811]|uniref:Uncharacterized protein n=1 Tax=Aspergillus piperis CBS 112811 TaxID=1448313 RepID=A0A8G1QR58_9EURO|nr:hypothetical protein BO85DRAFT_454193 [Aspergillus piperis CBS 112811]RAH52303.1 hypothetical protein BO85DRAFT_454193 [Aspergillus piperis CBS 112811]
MYAQIAQRSSSESLPIVKDRTKPRFRYLKVEGISTIILLLLATFGVIDLCYQAYNRIYTTNHIHIHANTQPEPDISCNCGDTITEALSNDCKYDSLAAAWLPPACRNDELTSAFEKVGSNPDGSWPYFADVNMTRPLSLKEVSMLPDTRAGGGEAQNVFYTTHRWHLVHCMYYWKKMFLSQELGTTIERRYNNVGHIEHCLRAVLEQKEGLDNVTTGAGVALHSDWINGRPDMQENRHGHNHK